MDSDLRATTPRVNRDMDANYLGFECIASEDKPRIYVAIALAS